MEEAGTLEDPVVVGNALQDEAQNISDPELKEAVELMGRMWVAMVEDDMDAMLGVASPAEAEAAADLIEQERGGTNLPSL